MVTGIGILEKVSAANLPDENSCCKSPVQEIWEAAETLLTTSFFSIMMFIKKQICVNKRLTWCSLSQSPWALLKDTIIFIISKTSLSNDVCNKQKRNSTSCYSRYLRGCYHEDPCNRPIRAQNYDIFHSVGMLT